jgi:hypothetical protein
MSLILAGVERAYELERVSTADASDELPPPLLLPPALVDAVFLSSLRDLPGEKGKQQGRVSKGDRCHLKRLLPFVRTEGPCCKRTRRGNGATKRREIVAVGGASSRAQPTRPLPGPSARPASGFLQTLTSLKTQLRPPCSSERRVLFISLCEMDDVNPTVDSVASSNPGHDGPPASTQLPAPVAAPAPCLQNSRWRSKRDASAQRLVRIAMDSMSARRSVDHLSPPGRRAGSRLLRVVGMPRSSFWSRRTPGSHYSRRPALHSRASTLLRSSSFVRSIMRI